jgi:hypothetical protein
MQKKISQKQSGIQEPPIREGTDNHFIIRLLNPSETSIWIWLTRFILFFGCYIVIGFYLTFGISFIPGGERAATVNSKIQVLPPSTNETWSIGIAAVLSYVVVLSTMALEAYIITPLYYGGENMIGLPMVHWMTWKSILDSVYHFINPNNYIDTRITEFQGKVGEPFMEQLTSSDSFWIDFVADVGDGFNPTYAVFSSMARSYIDLHGFRLPRSDIVIVGGDLAYPMPTHYDILSRFIRPVSWSYPESVEDKPRNMYLLAGNHEAFDSLHNYRHLILSRPKIGGWTVKNKTSYFVIQLPHNWWMFCVDPGNETEQDLDEPQIQYFTKIVKEKTNEDSRFIFTVHEPDWIKNSGHGYALYKRMIEFRENVLGHRLKLCLAGDLHYYRRMEEVSGTGEKPISNEAQFPSYITNKMQLIVAGNGGAFSHPTFAPEIHQVHLGEPFLSPSQTKTFQVVTDWPTPQDSASHFDKLWTKAFSWGKNGQYGDMIGILYMGFFLACNPWDYSPSTYDVGNTHYNTTSYYAWPNATDVWPNATYLYRMICSLWFWPPGLWMMIEKIILATTSLALNTKSQTISALSLAFSHFTAHFLFAFLCRKISDAIWAQAIYSGGNNQITFGYVILFCFLSNLTTYAFGYFLGVYITAVYFYITLRILKTHYNEPMSSIEWQDNKGFLRMCINREGDLDLYSIGIVQTPRKWRQRLMPDEYSDIHVGYFIPSDVALSCCLVEKVLIKRGGSVSTTSGGGLLPSPAAAAAASGADDKLTSSASPPKYYRHFVNSSSRTTNSGGENNNVNNKNDNGDAVVVS